MKLIKQRIKEGDPVNLKEASKKKEQLHNDLKYYNNQKDLNLQKIGVGAVNYDKELVQGGVKQDRFISYLEHLEKNDKLTLIELDKKIAEIQKEINIINDWIDEEKRILKAYGERKELVIYYRLEKGLTWQQIAFKTDYSVRQCQRIVEEYEKKN